MRRPLCLIFLPSSPKIGDPVLPATVGATGNVQLQVLLQAGQALIEFFGQPAAEGLGFGDGNLAELGARTRNDAAPEGRAFRGQSANCSAPASAAALRSGTFTMSRFCMLVVRSSPLPYCSARSAAACNWAAEMRPRRTDAPTSSIRAASPWTPT